MASLIYKESVRLFCFAGLESVQVSAESVALGKGAVQSAIFHGSQRSLGPKQHSCRHSFLLILLLMSSHLHTYSMTFPADDMGVLVKPVQVVPSRIWTVATVYAEMVLPISIFNFFEIQKMEIKCIDSVFRDFTQGYL